MKRLFWEDWSEVPRQHFLACRISTAVPQPLTQITWGRSIESSWKAYNVSDDRSTTERIAASYRSRIRCSNEINRGSERKGSSNGSVFAYTMYAERS
jgi:hypothetical protein